MGEVTSCRACPHYLFCKDFLVLLVYVFTSFECTRFIISSQIPEIKMENENENENKMKIFKN